MNLNQSDSNNEFFLLDVLTNEKKSNNLDTMLVIYSKLLVYQYTSDNLSQFVE